MNTKPLSLVLALAGSFALAGCASTYSGDPYYSQSSARQYDQRNIGSQTVYHGVVESVREVALQRNDGIGGGAVLGAVIGGLVGNQVGSGSGRTAATIGGAAAGGYIGDRIQDSRNYERGIEVTVRLDDGRRMAVVQNHDYRFHQGQRVRIVGHGANARVVPYSY